MCADGVCVWGYAYLMRVKNAI